ncbi:MAG: hypothetical protein EOO96_17420 [Pedobacter sp.]|nr:MAG: hypothetical protein EOO96_17420 [Pedobacter sp.]
MRTSIIPILIFLAMFQVKAIAQVTSYNFDPNKVNKTLAAKMDSLYQEDQKYRLELSKLEKQGTPKKQLDSLRKIVSAKDSTNLILVRQLIDKHGWLGAQDIGFQGTQALFLVIQHADLKTQKKYYPLIRKAEKEGNILSSNVAILEDRIAVREGKNQPYGSQGIYDSVNKKNLVYPVKDLKNLDSLRKSRGLPPMKEYKKNWDVDEYLADLKYAETALKKLKQANK